MNKLLSSRASRPCVLVALSAGLWLAAPPAAAIAADEAAVQRIRPSHFAEDTCRVIQEEAARRQLPASYFARLVWRESLFDPTAVSSKGAQGIAQFMPDTASERGLANPFDPATSLAASAHFLADLRAQFGSLGLAAAAYNAGPGRVESWRSGSTGLPLETQQYVLWITGHPAEDWLKGSQMQPLPISEKLSFMAACKKLAARKLTAKAPAGEIKTASVRRAPEAKLGLKRVEASEPGRVAVVFNPKPGSSGKPKQAKRKRH